MLISCKCSNFVASCTKSQLRGEDGVVTGNPDRNPAGGEVPIPVLLSQVFQQRFPRDFKFYNQFMDFFKRVSLVATIAFSRLWVIFYIYIYI